MVSSAPSPRQLSPDTPVWRYFDFAKFVSLLDRRELFFACASLLDDPFEGMLPRLHLEESEKPSPHRDRVLVSSWHVNPDESFAMWKLYAHAVEAIAVRTSVGRLQRAFASDKRVQVLIGQVQYLDYDCERLPELGPLSRFFCKAKPFSYENEVRAVIDLSARKAGKRDPLLEQVREERGFYVRTDLDQLFEEIYVSPTAGKWFLDLTRSVLKRFGVSSASGEVRHSVLAHPPSARRASKPDEAA